MEEYYIDKEKMKKFYQEYTSNDICSCVYCKNYLEHVANVYPYLKNYLKELDIDILKPIEIIQYPLDDKYLQYEVFYALCGNLEEDYKQNFKDLTIEFLSKDILYSVKGLEDYFLVRVSWIKLIKPVVDNNYRDFKHYKKINEIRKMIDSIKGVFKKDNSRDKTFTFDSNVLNEKRQEIQKIINELNDECNKKYRENFNYHIIDSEDYYNIIKQELIDEMQKDHPLYKTAFYPIAYCSSRDDELFYIRDKDKEYYVVIHLTWKHNEVTEFLRPTYFYDLETLKQYLREQY